MPCCCVVGGYLAPRNINVKNDAQLWLASIISASIVIKTASPHPSLPCASSCLDRKRPTRIPTNLLGPVLQPLGDEKKRHPILAPQNHERHNNNNNNNNNNNTCTAPPPAVNSCATADPTQLFLLRFSPCQHDRSETRPEPDPG